VAILEIVMGFGVFIRLIFLAIPLAAKRQIAWLENASDRKKKQGEG
jgi:hypothetical protein